MTEYQIEANTRRCAISGRELKTGERFYSVLLEEAGKFHRKDYSSEVWQGPPQGTFSFWTGRITASDHSRLPTIDEESLVDCFERLENETESGRIRFRYIVALLLMRRKRFRFEEITKEGEQTILHLRCSRDRTIYRVVDPHLTDEEMATVQGEVLGLLGWQ